MSFLLLWKEVKGKMLSELILLMSFLVVAVVSTRTMDDEDSNLLNNEHAFIVMIVMLTATVFLILVLLAKRQLLRVLLISKRGAHTTVGSGAPRKLGHEIEASIRRVERLNIEPRTLAENLQLPSGGLRSQTYDSSANNLYNLRYRFKAIDNMTYLDDLLCSIDVRYCRKSHQTVRDHLTSLQQQPPQPPLSGCETTCENVIKLYEHARYGKNDFGQQEYEQLETYIEDLKIRLREKVIIPGTLVSSDTPGSSKEIGGPSQRKSTRDKPCSSVIYNSSGELRRAVQVCS